VEKWVYPTELPLGNSPTIYNGVAYVGGLDRQLHAVDAFTGQGLWTFAAEAGFETNPLVVEGLVIAGDRDGYLYAVHAEGGQAGHLAWKYQTGGPILQSAAYKDGAVFFASNDGHAYALDVQSGALVWQSEMLPGAGSTPGGRWSMKIKSSSPAPTTTVSALNWVPALSPSRN
jgi:serine/threonine-protein kinase